MEWGEPPALLERIRVIRPETDLGWIVVSRGPIPIDRALNLPSADHDNGRSDYAEHNRLRDPRQV